MKFHLRDEDRSTERRAPVTPKHAQTLIEAGWEVDVETSAKRIFSDSDYAAAGCHIKPAGSWIDAPGDTVILGLKELPPLPETLPHRMIHFAHIYKDQHGWRDELRRFARGGGRLYDLEFLVDSEGRRKAAFGYWAGWVGAALALWRHLARDHGVAGPSKGLSSFENREALRSEIETLAQGGRRRPRAIVIGAKGRSGQGAVDALSIACDEITEWDKEETADLDRTALTNHDILVNCVLVSGPGLLLLTPEDLEGLNQRIRTVSDVSCDPLSDYNPLPIYREPTSWERPFITVGRNGDGEEIELTAVDNLPSLLPKEASEDFSRQLLPSLLAFDHGEEWRTALDIFESKIRELETAG
ncbi:MAG: saccharopine dehydrogenase [Rhizobiaceae bacterium MnEN-MB40S]|nr:MAG: saccharopine dehydrogenase [Rhizobiaceae bacterium MnEN-MB40S]